MALIILHLVPTNYHCTICPTFILYHMNTNIYNYMIDIDRINLLIELFIININRILNIYAQ